MFLYLSWTIFHYSIRNKKHWSSVGINWDNLQIILFDHFPQYFQYRFPWIFASSICPILAIAKFQCIVSCSTNFNDYLKIWRNRSQILEVFSITINPENRQTGAKGAQDNSNYWTFFHEGLNDRKTLNQQSYPFVLNIIHDGQFPTLSSAYLRSSTADKQTKNK